MSTADTHDAGEAAGHGQDPDQTGSPSSALDADRGDVGTVSKLAQGQAVDGQERKVDLQIMAVLVGVTVLIAAVIARFIFDSESHSGFLAMVASILLGGPIVYGAIKSQVTGRFTRDRQTQDAGGQDSGPSHEHDTHGSVGGSHMEDLVAIAIIASFARGAAGYPDGFLVCAAVAFFMLIASLIEHRTAAGALKTIESLIRITPTKAVVIKDGQETEVSAADLRPGDRVLVLPGDNIPGDGVVREGVSTVDQANITGESMPVEKAAGDEAFAGTINETGRLVIEITRAGEDSTLGKVQSLILQAAQSKPAVARELSKYSSYYTPVVLILAFIMFVATGDLNNSISLLLIACPCALILCGPTAIVASLSSSARLGVLVKSVSDLEVMRRVTAIVFDKTGTLTTGDLSVTRMKPAPGVDGADLLQFCVSAETNSRHPVARAVIDVAERAKLTPTPTTEFEEVSGRGVRATLDDGSVVLVGREAFLTEQGVDLSVLDTSETEGLSLLFVAKDGQAAGWLGLADQPRQTAGAALSELDELGVKRRVMITGDRWSPARRVAEALGLTDFTAEALPGDKLELVEQLKEEGHTVAVVGDGVNDGPALAAGDVSIAMGAAGSDVAINSASIALMNNSLNRIPFMVDLSRKTVSVIRQNLAGTLIYVLFMLGLLLAGLMVPLIAALGHVVSSIIVIFNSARLVREGENLHEPESHVETGRRARRLEHVSGASPATA
ncbi:MAG: cation-translocating P-type ATPase [Planctomycetota bacterium]